MKEKIICSNGPERKKQVCRVNGVIVGFIEEWTGFGKSENTRYRWDTRFSNEVKPDYDDPDIPKKRIEEIFTEWLNGIKDGNQ